MTSPQPALAAWQRDSQAWAAEQERLRHTEALWQYGELAVFCLLWHVEDFKAGLAVRCPRCFDDGTASTEDQIAAVYGQGNQADCPVCFNTTFAGVTGGNGIRAMVVRPAVFTDTDRDQRRQARGVMNPGAVNAESTPDFRIRTGDYLFRSDQSRWSLRVPRRTTLRTGFAHPWLATAGISYNQAQCAAEDPASPAFIIPPSGAQIAALLGAYTRLPVDYSGFEQLNGPLIPEEQPPPSASGQQSGTISMQALEQP